MARVNGLEKMTYAELRDLRSRVDAAMVEAKAAQKRTLREKMDALAAEAGLTVAEILGGKTAGSKAGPKGTKVAVKYRNPKDPAQTWTGRGRRPAWMVEALKKGQKIESFLV